MARCDSCGQEMLTAPGCVEQPDVWRWGEEPMEPPLGEPVTWKCHDCLASPGTYHHPGCDMEVCQLCNGQRLFCEHGALANGSR
jgi:hypothetical protein